MIGALSTGALAFLRPPDGRSSQGFTLGRVTTDWIHLYKEPSFRSEQLTRIPRDSLVNIQSSLHSDDGPRYNPEWHRLADGYAHSGYVQIVKWQPQTPQMEVAEEGELFEVSVPFTRSYREADPTSPPLYRLYYQSTAWVEAAVRGADGRIWYRLVDDLLNIRYFARAEHLRRVLPEEISPISPNVPLHEKHVEISLARQELLAFERERLVFRTRISSGIPDPRPRENGIPTITPTGNFYVDKKMPVRHMGDGSLAASLDAYELPGVPWVSYFHFTGVAFHGTYWHSNYGTPMSHGCINMQAEEARWLFRWTLPRIEPDESLRIARGTAVLVA